MKSILIFSLAAFSGLLNAEQIKQSRSGICHDQSSPWFNKTKNYTAYSSITECIQNGGRLPKNSKLTADAKKNNRPFSALYVRKDWRHWIDADGDCQDTRQEVLIRASSTAVTFKTSKKCKVKSGTFYDYFSDKTWRLPSDLDVDHIVPLSWAHQHGAANWSKKEKMVFANDFDNLIAVEDNLNQSKSDQGPNEWLPPNQRYRCDYVRHFDSIVNKYQLRYTAKETRTIGKMLQHCD